MFLMMVSMPIALVLPMAPLQVGQWTTLGWQEPHTGWPEVEHWGSKWLRITGGALHYAKKAFFNWDCLAS